VEVFCVEHGRWEGEYKPFQSGDTIVPGEVRAAAQEFRSQSAVWDRVARKNAVAGVAPSTGTVRALVADPGIKRRVDAITARLRTAFEGNASAVGMICWIDGRIHTADLFANAGLFTAARDKMLRSYATDVVLSRGARSVPVDMRACRRFLADIQTSRRTVEESTESDALLRVGGGRVTGFESGRASMNRALPASAAPYGQPPRPGEVRPPWGTYSGYGHGTYRPSDR
jgi:hypothetical protein